MTHYDDAHPQSHAHGKDQSLQYDHPGCPQSSLVMLCVVKENGEDHTRNEKQHQRREPRTVTDESEKEKEKEGFRHTKNHHFI